MKKLFQIAPRPRVKVHVLSKSDTLERITLCLYSNFTLECDSPHLAKAFLPWLEHYAKGTWTLFSLPPYKTPFARKTASYLQTTRPGKLLSYKELSEAIGQPHAARAIGNFCKGNLFPLLIPCHRVIPSRGGLGGFTPDPQIKKELLHFEGINLD